MKIYLRNISGIDDAILSMFFTKRTWTFDLDVSVREIVHTLSRPNGSIKVPHHTTDPNWKIEMYDKFIDYISKVVKYGIGDGNVAMLEEGHETILRFIDFSVVVEDLHRGAMDDLDSHAMRMNNRIIRSSSRISPSDKVKFNPNELSHWYSDKAIPFAAVIHQLISEDKLESLFDDGTLSRTININGNTFVFTEYGYINEKYLDDQDVKRGLFPLGMKSSCIFRVSFHDMRHIYKRRNVFTHAAPELKLAIEQFADQIADAIPILGKYIRYDHCDLNNLTHISKIHKTGELG